MGGRAEAKPQASSLPAEASSQRRRTARTPRKAELIPRLTITGLPTRRRYTCSAPDASTWHPALANRPAPEGSIPITGAPAESVPVRVTPQALMEGASMTSTDTSSGASMSGASMSGTSGALSGASRGGTSRGRSADTSARSPGVSARSSATSAAAPSPGVGPGVLVQARTTPHRNPSGCVHTLAQLMVSLVPIPPRGTRLPATPQRRFEDAGSTRRRSTEMSPARRAFRRHGAWP